MEPEPGSIVKCIGNVPLGPIVSGPLLFSREEQGVKEMAIFPELCPKAGGMILTAHLSNLPGRN